MKVAVFFLTKRIALFSVSLHYEYDNLKKSYNENMMPYSMVQMDYLYDIQRNLPRNNTVTVIGYGHLQCYFPVRYDYGI
jgi:hypothetical protein